MSVIGNNLSEFLTFVIIKRDLQFVGEGIDNAGANSKASERAGA